MTCKNVLVFFAFRKLHSEKTFRGQHSKNYIEPCSETSREFQKIIFREECLKLKSYAQRITFKELNSKKHTEKHSEQHSENKIQIITFRKIFRETFRITFIFT